MGVFTWLFGKAPKPVGKFQGAFKMLDGYRPVFTSWNKDIYESDLIRAAIHARATHISKLKIEVVGAARPALQRKLAKAPNEMLTWSQFMYLLSTRLDANNTAFIVPVYNEYGEPLGVYCPLPDRCSIVEYSGKPYLKYRFSNGKEIAIEKMYCGIMTKFQYKSDVFGETNAALKPTTELVHIQNQGIEEGVKSAATYRFYATLANFSKDEDLKKERERFSKTNFSKESGGGGLLLFPNTYKDINQVNSKPFTADAEQMKLIDDRVYKYFGVNEKILRNEAYGDAWSAFYEGAIEPFAIQFSEVMTKMLFTLREQSEGNMVMATANRLQYMSNSDKLNVTSQLLDRGIISLNDARDIWNLPPVEGGDTRFIRGEYINVNDRTEENENEQEDS